MSRQIAWCDGRGVTQDEAEIIFFLSGVHSQLWRKPLSTWWHLRKVGVVAGILRPRLTSFGKLVATVFLRIAED